LRNVLAIAQGLFRRRPKPFVIVGMPRTGSTLLLTGLSQHPEIRAYGELMHPMGSERATTHAIRREDGLSWFRDGADPIRFLRDEVYNYDHPREIKTVGFKLFGDNAAEHIFVRMKDEIPGLRVVHICRPNYLASLLSGKVAWQTKRYVRFAGDKTEEPPTPRINLEPDEVARYFDGMRSVDGFLERHFGGPDYIKVNYDALASSFECEIERVYRFLGVSGFEPRPMVEKQLRESPQAILTNYSELASFFSGTAFSSFFS
jgi:LPS sulfotransferase NodH